MLRCQEEKKRENETEKQPQQVATKMTNSRQFDGIRNMLAENNEAPAS